MPTQAPHSIFLDWEFWSAVAAVTALLLSQLPPIHLWLRPRRRLEIEVHSRVQVTHRIGNPNLWMYVSVRNTGGRDVEIRSIQASLARDGTDLGIFPAESYFEDSEAKSAVLFIPIVLKPGDEWAHGANFFRQFDRATDKWYREADLALKEDLRKKAAAREPERKDLLEADPQLVAPFKAFFEKTFIWSPGEYVISLRVNTRDKKANFTAQYRFMLFESDTAELRSYADDFKFGGGISWNVERHTGLWVPITPHDRL